MSSPCIDMCPATTWALHQQGPAINMCCASTHPVHQVVLYINMGGAQVQPPTATPPKHSGPLKAVGGWGWGKLGWQKPRDSPIGESQDSPHNTTHMHYHYRIF